MRLIRWLRLAVVAVCVAAGAVVALPASAQAASSCTNTLDWYHNRYEVVASERITCNDGMREVWSRVKLTTPRYLPYDRLCEPARECSASTYMSNAAGSQTYCATAYGFYRRDKNDTWGTFLPEISQCISA